MRPPWRERIRHVARIGAVFGQRTQLWWDLPVIESFDLLRDIYRVPPADYHRTRDELIASKYRTREVIAELAKAVR